MRAVIDIGTNSVLLLLARRGPDGALEVLRDQSTITRLGQGAGASGMLALAAIARTVDCLAEYRKVAEAAGAERIVAVATEGVRMARNQSDFLEPAAQALGVAVRLLSGAEEAELSYLSVARETPEGGPLRVLDIGGGSTELVIGEGLEVRAAVSHPVGSVRLTERLISADPPTPAMVEAVRGEALAAFRALPVAPHPVLHALAGTATTTAALLLGLAVYDRTRVDGSRFTVAQVQALRDALAGETLAQRCERPGLERGRADVIVAGVTILLAALEHCGAETLVVRDRGLRYALM